MRWLIIAGLTVSLLLSGCGGPEAPRQNRSDGSPLRVVVGFYPLADLAEAIGGDRADVVNLTPAGAEAHDLELTPSQVDAVLEADVVLLVGGGFQPALEEASQRREEPAVDVAPSGTEDPHFWLSPESFVEAVPAVVDALGEADPKSLPRFAAAATEYTRRLEELHREFEAGLDDCERTTFVTTHAAFGHLATSYDLQQESIAGLSPEAEPDPGRIGELAERIEQLGVTTVFVEPLASRATAETLAREAGVSVAELDPLESLRAESDGDYFSVMRDNLATIRNGLGCP